MAQVSLEQFHSVNPKTAGIVADLLAAVATVQPPQKPGWRGVLVAKFKGWGIPDHVRHAFTDAVWGRWSSNEFEPHECRAIAQWMDDGGHRVVGAIVLTAEVACAVKQGAGQVELVGLEHVRQELDAQAEKGATEMIENPPQDVPEGPVEAPGATKTAKGIVDAPQSQAAPPERPWTSDALRVAKFFNWTQKLGLHLHQTLEALDAETIYDYQGTAAEAAHAVRELLSELQEQPAAVLPPYMRVDAMPDFAYDPSHYFEPTHNEARALIWCHMLDPNGVDWSLTLREGALAQLILDMARTGVQLSTVLLAEGWRTQDGATHISPQAVQAAVQPPQEWTLSRQLYAVPFPQAVQAAVQPPQAAAPPPPGMTAPPAPSGFAPPPPQPSANGNFIDAVKFQTSTTLNGNPTVDFFAAGHQYADVTWGLSGENQSVGERIIADFPELAQVGWTAAHFDAPNGTAYNCRLRVHYTLSEKKTAKGNPYKNITSIELREV